MQIKSRVRHHRTPEERAELLAAYERSQLTQGEFVAQHGIGLTTLQRWLHRRQNDDPVPAEKERFIEVPNPLGARRTTAAYRLEFPQGLVLEVAPGFQAGELCSLVHLIQAL